MLLLSASFPFGPKKKKTAGKINSVFLTVPVGSKVILNACTS